jgi:hypothetical protein
MQTVSGVSSIPVANQRIPTRDPACPPLVRFAKQVLHEIKKKADTGTMDSDDNEDIYNNINPNERKRRSRRR